MDSSFWSSENFLLFLGGKNSIPLSALNDPKLSEPKTLIKKTYKNIKHIMLRE